MPQLAKGLDGLFFQKDLNIEKIICELVDNSVEHPKGGSVDVYILIEEEVHSGDDTHPYSFRVHVYDNGSGFTSEDKLHDAFELSSDIESMKKKIGKFHFGMKTAPLYKFNHFSLITKIGNNFCNRSIRYPGLYDPKNNYRWSPKGVDLKNPNPNPGNIVPPHVGESGITNLMTKHNLTTCAVCTSPRMSLLPKEDAKRDTTFFNELIVQLKLYLGIVYQEVIEKNTATLYIGKTMDTMEEILPCDPFLSAYTPDGMASLAIKETDPDTKMMLETIAPFGTLAGERLPIKVKIPKEPKYKNKKDQTIHVTPYYVPKARFIDLLRTKYSAEDLNGRFIMQSHNLTTKVSDKQKEVSSGMVGKGMQGFYFYRGNRAIIFGAEAAHSNQGFWNGIAGFKSLSSDGWANTVRVKVEYDPSPELDRMFNLAGNKNTFDGSPHGNIWAAIKKGIIQTIDGDVANHAPPFNVAAPYWVGGKGSSFHIGSHKAYPPSKKCVDCSFFHEEGKCPKGECSTCGLSKSANKCLLSSCNTKCSNPKCGKMGHTKEECPESKCPNCTGYTGFSCACCTTCKEPCLCPYKICHIKPPKCTCAGGGGGKTPPPGDLFKIKPKGKYHMVKFDITKDAQSIKMINEILTLIGKSKSDL
jgi:hypothetical protein